MLGAPVLPKVEAEVNTQQYGRYEIGPLQSGYGLTLGTALRRVLLSSLEGAAITAVRITDVPHEFSAIPGVREDVIQIMLRLKQVRLVMNGEGPLYMTLRVDGEGVVTAGDIIAPPEIQILNPDLYLFTVDSANTHLDMEFTVERGRGYLSADSRGRMPIGVLPVDAIFNPIKRVAFHVEQARVGQLTNYDRLILDIWSDGRIQPLDALKQAAAILVQHLRLIAGVQLQEEMEEVEQIVEERVPQQAYAMPIEDLNLSVRVYNALKRSGITNVGEVLELMMRGREALLNTIRNFGEKSLEELQERLRVKGFLVSDTASDAE